MKRDPIDKLSLRAFLAISFIYFFGLTLLIFSPILLQTDRFISIAQTDIDRYFFPIRSFLSQQLRAGHLPLWNPYLFGGVPALGNFQYAELYPPTWLLLLLPTTSAINLIIALHIAMAGFFTAAWGRYRGPSTVAALLAGTIFMLCGTLQVRVYAGHLTSICSAAWIPAFFLCVDAILDRKKSGLACLAAGMVLALQLLAGYPQIAYCTLLAAVIYVIIRLLNQPGWLGRAAMLVTMCLLGGCLAAAQLLPGLEAITESIRSEALPYNYATAFSISPENLLTLLAPQLFGDGVHSDIFSRWALTENSLFLGAVSLTLVLIAVRHSRSRSDIAITFVAAIFLLLSLGRYTPVYQLAFWLVPGIDRLHAPAKFVFIFALGSAILAGRGFDQLQHLKRPRRIALIAFSCAGLLASGALLIWQSRDSGIDGLWGRILTWLIESGQSWGSLAPENAATKVADSARLASHQLTLAAISFILISVVLFFHSRYQRFIYFLPLLALVELLMGAQPFLRSTQPIAHFPSEWIAHNGNIEPDQRILITQGTQQNLPAMLGMESIGGYDPLIPKRWANLVMPLLGASPQSGDLIVRRFLPSSRWAMLRLGRLLPPIESIELEPPMPRFNLIDRFSVVAGPDASLEAIRFPDFDPHKVVILESQPDLLPRTIESNGPAGQVHLVRMSTDDLEIEAALDRPAILLITDAYSTGWRVRRIASGPQSSYSVMPANYALRAIPLVAGAHHFILEYRPRYLTAGILISSATFALYVMFCVGMQINRRGRGGASATSLPKDYQSPSA